MMAKKVSPFAALTNEEKQIKWLEYQSIRLPYTSGSVDTWQQETETYAESNGAQHTHASAQEVKPPESPVQPSDGKGNRPLPPPEVLHHPQTRTMQQGVQSSPAYTIQPQGEAALRPAPISNPANVYQKTRHHQYDAVIERMKQAAKKTSQFQAWSK